MRVHCIFIPVRQWSWKLSILVNGPIPYQPLSSLPPSACSGGGIAILSAVSNWGGQSVSELHNESTLVQVYHRQSRKCEWRRMGRKQLTIVVPPIYSVQFFTVVLLKDKTNLREYHFASVVVLTYHPQFPPSYISVKTNTPVLLLLSFARNA